MTLEKTDGPSLLINGSTAGVAAKILVALIMGWPTWHQASWHQMGVTFVSEGGVFAQELTGLNIRALN